MTASDIKIVAWLIAILVTTLIGLAGIGVFCWQCFLWLRDGVWTSYDFRDIWTYFGGGEPAFEWRALRNVANLILDAPVFTTAIAAAAAMSKMIPEQLEERRKRRKRSTRKRAA
jgi:hypothetical protein